jgi:SAM-dependent methyltransferase
MPDGRFTLTPLGGILRTDAVGSMRDLAIALTAPGHWLPWGRLLDAVRRGERQTPAALGQELFEYYANNPAEGHAFTGAMSNSSVPIADELAEVLDTSSARWVVDVGGASGAIIAALLEKNPSLEGIILERPDVVSRAKAAVAERGLSSRCHVVEGDFFEAVPEADVHILKYIIHDWDDEQSIKILSNCAHSLRKNGRVVIVERLIPVDGHISDTPLMDLNMLVLLPGRERNASHYGDLLDRAGLRLERIHDTGSPLKVLEATLRAQ